MIKSSLLTVATIATATVVVILSMGSVKAFQEVGGNACTTTGAPCSYSYINGDGDTIQVSSTCSPNGFCADNGATGCTTDDNCYNYCGSDGICGGEGATCNTQSPSAHNQFDTACFTPGFTCSTDGTTGTCSESGTQPSAGARRRKRMQEVKNALMARVVRPRMVEARGNAIVHHDHAGVVLPRAAVNHRVPLV